jgi:hypothetical protein
MFIRVPSWVGPSSASQLPFLSLSLFFFLVKGGKNEPLCPRTEKQVTQRGRRAPHGPQLAHSTTGTFFPLHQALELTDPKQRSPKFPQVLPSSLVKGTAREYCKKGYRDKMMDSLGKDL